MNVFWVMGNCPEGCVSACMIQPKEGYRDKLCGRLCTLGRSTGLGSIVSICQDYELKTVVVGHSVDDGVENVPTL